MKIISEEQVKNFLNIGNVIGVVKKLYLENTVGQIYAGNRIYMPIRGEENVGQWLVANSLSQPFFGSKFSSVFPNNVSIGLPSTISKISLYSAQTGELQALIDANYLTAIKTGASAAVATDLMARKEASVLAIIGTGLQAYSQVLAIQEVRTLEKVYVYDVIPERIEHFISLLEKEKKYPYSIESAISADSCVEQADIVCTCTTAQKPVFSGKKLKPGAHVNAIGSFTPFMQEIDEETVLKSSKIITEHVEGLWDVAGDILTPFNKGKITKDKVSGSLGDALSGKFSTRDTENEFTLYESVGSGVLDIGLSIYIYQNLYKEG
ncbi:ornithine cyclodeaminase family protein [Enterococcus casseliflavus]|uniref:ornithine cyclodeaminase family protein n=1 Tax=Enterococcus casseliflavus TaxID=37734 RepID=UPI0018831D39|nr:ornithine cyclodeaminase family protein [Enterococcus casseliflavus]MBE9909304.1 ornithine cyclodeaminase family protein [Enterococcus casseliflavus]